MAQVTETLVRDELKRVEEGELPMFTRWEYEQLMRAWLDREALRKDAERYRWLRDNPWPSPVQSVVVRHANAAWDATIDAAMAADAPGAA